jgi:hypothetical protein
MQTSSGGGVNDEFGPHQVEPWFVAGTLGIHAAQCRRR